MKVSFSRTNSMASSPSRQQGAITLAMSLILLILITLVTIALSRNISIEQKVANNDVRSKIAFEAAEAGIAKAFEYLSDPDNRDNLAGFNDEDADPDTTDDTPAMRVGTTTNGYFETTMATITTGLPDISIVSKGYSDDGSARRAIYIRGKKVDVLANIPDNPLVTRSDVIIDGSATIYNPEGDSTIWSGENIDLGSNNSTSTEIADPYDPDYPACMNTPLACDTISSSNKLTVGPDIIENDTTLRNFIGNTTLFENYFGMSITAFEGLNVTVKATPDNANDLIREVANEVILIEGDMEFVNNTTVGCSETVTGSNICTANDPDDSDFDPDDPQYESSILIVKGNATFNGTVQFYGLVFVTGSVEIKGNTTVYGSMVVGGDLKSDAGGSLDIVYHSGLLDNGDELGAYFAVPGSWRDFDG